MFGSERNGKKHYRVLGSAGRLLLCFMVVGFVGMYSIVAHGADFPTREINWIIFQSPGGSIDVTSRLIQPYLKAQGIETRFEYIKGATGRIARAKLYTAKPDGYTIMTESSPSGALGEIVYKGAYKLLEFEPLFGWNVVGWQLCVDKNSPIRTIKDLVALSKKRPIKAASIGRGGVSHLQLVLFKNILNIPMNIVHFSGSSKAYPQLWGGHIDVACSGPGSGSRNKDKLHFLTVFNDKGELALPGVPTLKSQGYEVPSMNQTWYTMTSPKVPADRVKRLADAFEKAFADDKLMAAQKKAGIKAVTRLPRNEMIKRVKLGYESALKYKDQLN